MPELNTKLIELTADYIEANPREYKQGSWTHREGIGQHLMKLPKDSAERHHWFCDCDTPACIAGTMVFIAMRTSGVQPKGFDSERLKRYMTPKELEQAATDLSGISKKQAPALFDSHPKGLIGTFPVRPEVACRVLRNLAETGKVSWVAADKEVGNA